MPIAAPPWTEFLSCPVCCNEFDSTSRGPISLPCCHTICRACLGKLQKRQCPFDQTELKGDVSRLPVNAALVELASGGGATVEVPASIPASDAEAWVAATSAVRQLAVHLRHDGGAPLSLSRPMQRKLVALVNCQLAEPDGRDRAMRAARSLGDRTVSELILHHQNPQHLSTNLWAAVRARGCQFLGPAMQEEVLKLILLALEDGSALSRKVLVMFVVQRLEPHFPQASKTSIGHVVQLLYRASSFKVSKRDGDSSLMQLKEEFRNYDALRREHDAQIVQIATEAGLRIAPDQWSSLLYGDAQHKSHMQSIVDKLQSPAAFAHSIDELLIALQRTQDPGRLSQLRPQLDILASIDAGSGGEGSGGNSLTEVARALEACRDVVAGLVEFMRRHGAATRSGPTEQPAFRYKVSLCRDLAVRGTCPRGPACTFAHSNDELDKFRAKNRAKAQITRNINKDDDALPDSIFFPNDVTELSGCESGFPSTSGPVLPMPSNYQGGHQHGHPYIHSPTNPPPMYHQPFPASSTAPTHHFLTGQQAHQAGGYPADLAAYSPRNMSPQDTAMRQKQLLWRSHSLPNNKGTIVAKVANNWAVLQHRRQELLNQLERVVARCTNNILRSDGGGMEFSEINFPLLVATVNARTNGNYPSVPLDPTTVQYVLGNTGPTPHRLHPSLYSRAESVVSEEEFIPFDPPVVSKFGPIARDGKGGEGPLGGHPVLCRQSTAPPSTNNQQWIQFCHHGYPGGGNNPIPEPASRDNNYSSAVTPPSEQQLTNRQLQRHDIASSEELLIESQRMKHQLKTLEKKINDLKIHSF